MRIHSHAAITLGSKFGQFRDEFPNAPGETRLDQSERFVGMARINSAIRFLKLALFLIALILTVGDVVMADWFLCQLRDIRRRGSLALLPALKAPRQAASMSPRERTG